MKQKDEDTELNMPQLLLKIRGKQTFSSILLIDKTNLIMMIIVLLVEKHLDLDAHLAELFRVHEFLRLVCKPLQFYFKFS